MKDENIEVSFLSEFAGEEGSTVYLSKKIPPEKVEEVTKKIKDAICLALTVERHED